MARIILQVSVQKETNLDERIRSLAAQMGVPQGKVVEAAVTLLEKELRRKSEEPEGGALV